MEWQTLKGEGERFFELLKGDVLFLFVIGNTKTAEVKGITVAGANPELIKFTPPADVELLHYGECRVIPFPPATPDGKPTPAIITYTALRLTDVPFLVVDAGLMVKPKTPFVTINAPVGENIAERDAMDLDRVEESFEMAVEFGKRISKSFDVLMIGESIPAGTTTALAVLRAFGIDGMVSSSMPENPIDIKLRVVERALKRIRGDETPLEIVAKVGDPVMVGVCGIAVGSRRPVVLAGGSQMVAMAHVIDRIGRKDTAIATTVYVANDSDSLKYAPCPVLVADPGLDKSKKPGLRAYAEGFVKEGVGAGGATLLAYARGFKKEEFLKEIERSYETVIESKL